jgi:hypothetical protein
MVCMNVVLFTCKPLLHHCCRVGRVPSPGVACDSEWTVTCRHAAETNIFIHMHDFILLSDCESRDRNVDLKPFNDFYDVQLSK